MKKVFTILMTREVSRYEKISADNLEDAVKVFEKKVKDEGFDVPSDWKYQGGTGIYNMSNNPDGD